MPTPRELRFATLDEIVQDAEHLLAVGYEQTEKWNLAQMCGHIAEWMRFPMDGFPRAPFIFRMIFAVARNTIGRRELLKMLDSGVMPSGPTIPETIPPPDSDAAAAVEKLKQTVERMKAYTGELQPSPFFGPLTREEWFGLNRVHAAHHLNYLIPRS